MPGPCISQSGPDTAFAHPDHSVHLEIRQLGWLRDHHSGWERQRRALYQPGAPPQDRPRRIPRGL